MMKEVIGIVVLLFAVASACRYDEDCIGMCHDRTYDRCDMSTHHCQCHPLLDMERLASRPVNHHVATRSNVGADTQCVLCEFILTVLSDIIQENFTRNDVEKAFDIICALMPDTISNECTAFVDTYTSLIINVLVQDIADPHEVCRTIKVCKSAARQKPVVNSSSIK